MNLIDIDSVRVLHGRVRTEFDAKAHHALMNDILEFGLFHPPVVSKGFALLAGERRLRAIKRIYEEGLQIKCNDEIIPKGMIPITYIHEMDKVKLLRAELAENTARVDLSWQEKARATERLVELNRALHGEETVALPKGDRTVAVPRALVETVMERKDIAQDCVNISQTDSVRSDLIVAEWLKGGDDEVAAAPTRKEALKIIESKLVEGHRQALAREFKQQTSVSPHTLVHGDSRELLETIPDGAFDVILTDPPYGMGLSEMPDLQGGVAHHYDDSREASDLVMQAIFAHASRITKERAHLYMFCDISRFFSLKAALEAMGNWVVWNRPLIWYRADSTGMLPDAEHGPRRTYEAILFAYKGSKRVLQVRNDVLAYASDREERSAARKPVPLLVDLLQRSCLPGDRVFDPCCGSGPIFAAAKALDLHAYGIEQNEAIFGLASQRLKEIS